MAFAAPVLFLLGRPLLENAAEALKRRVLSTDLLLLCGVLASYLYSAISVFRGNGHIYFEVGCVILMLVMVGRWLEAAGRVRAGESLDALERLSARPRADASRRTGGARASRGVAAGRPDSRSRRGAISLRRPDRRGNTSIDEQLVTWRKLAGRQGRR